jgi:hypothetical protein
LIVRAGVFSFFMNDRRLAFGSMGGDDDDI